MHRPEKGRGREFAGLFFLFFSAFLFLSLLSFHPNDPSFNLAVSSGWKIKNSVGDRGCLFCRAPGGGLRPRVPLVWPVFFLYLGLSRFFTRLSLSKGRWIGLFGLFIAFEAWSTHPWLSDVPEDAYGLVGGGYLGRDIITRYTLPYLRPVGAFLLWTFVTIVSFQLVAGFSWRSLWDRILGVVGRARGEGMAEIRAERKAAAPGRTRTAQGRKAGAQGRDERGREGKGQGRARKRSRKSSSSTWTAKGSAVRKRLPSRSRRSKPKPSKPNPPAVSTGDLPEHGTADHASGSALVADGRHTATPGGQAERMPQ